MTAKPAKPKNQAERAARIRAILEKLNEMYPNATCALIHHSPWELLVATILSAQCTDKRVNEVTPGLFKKYPTPKILPRRARRCWRMTSARRGFSTTKRSP